MKKGQEKVYRRAGHGFLQADLVLGDGNLGTFV